MTKTPNHFWEESGDGILVFVLAGKSILRLFLRIIKMR